MFVIVQCGFGRYVYQIEAGFVACVGRRNAGAYSIQFSHLFSIGLWFIAFTLICFEFWISTEAVYFLSDLNRMLKCINFVFKFGNGDDVSIFFLNVMLLVIIIAFVSILLLISFVYILTIDPTRQTWAGLKIQPCPISALIFCGNAGKRVWRPVFVN